MSRVNECGHPERRHVARGMCARCYEARPEVRERKRAYQARYQARPEVREHLRAYKARYQARYQARPEVREHRRAYRARPEVREHRNARERMRYAAKKLENERT